MSRFWHWSVAERGFTVKPVTHLRFFLTSRWTQNKNSSKTIFYVCYLFFIDDENYRFSVTMYTYTVHDKHNVQVYITIYKPV